MTVQEHAKTLLKNKIMPYKKVFLFSMLVGLIAFMYAFVNKLPNHDDVTSLFSKGASISSGRWGLILCRYIFPDFSMPWIYGIISITMVSVASCIIINIFDIKTAFLKYILAGLIISFPSLTNIFSFMFSATSYCLSFLLSVVSVFLWVRRSYISKALAVICLVLSMGIYQSYLAVAASLFVVYSIKETISGIEIKPIIKRGISFILCLGVSVAIYFLINKAFQAAYSVEFNSYANTALDPGASLIKRVAFTYGAFIMEFFRSVKGTITSTFGRVLHIIAGAITAFELIFMFAKKKMAFSRWILLFALIAVFPASVYCLILFVNYHTIHIVGLWSFVSVYVFSFVVADHFAESELPMKAGRTLKKAICLLAAALVISNVYLANEVYLRMDVKMRSVQSYYTMLITRIEMTDGFDENTKIALIGDRGFSDADYRYPEFSDIGGRSFYDSEIYVNIYSYREYITYYLGFDGEFASDEEIEMLMETEEYKAMGQYPYADSIKKIGDYMVVRFEPEPNDAN